MPVELFQIIFLIYVEAMESGYREETLATQASGGGGGGGGGKTIEMWRWWYIVSLFTKQC